MNRKEIVRDVYRLGVQIEEILEEDQSPEAFAEAARLSVLRAQMIKDVQQYDKEQEGSEW